MRLNDGIIYGNRERELIFINKDNNTKCTSKFKYGIGTSIKYKENVYIMDGNKIMYKISCH